MHDASEYGRTVKGRALDYWHRFDIALRDAQTAQKRSRRWLLTRAGVRILAGLTALLSSCFAILGSVYLTAALLLTF